MNSDVSEVLRDKITAGLKAAVASALEEHRRAGRRVAIWRDGRVQLVLPPAPSHETAMLLPDRPDQG